MLAVACDCPKTLYSIHSIQFRSWVFRDFLSIASVIQFSCFSPENCSVKTINRNKASLVTTCCSVNRILPLGQLIHRSILIYLKFKRLVVCIYIVIYWLALWSTRGNSYGKKFDDWKQFKSCIGTITLQTLLFFYFSVMEPNQCLMRKTISLLISEIGINLPMHKS